MPTPSGFVQTRTGVLAAATLAFLLVPACRRGPAPGQAGARNPAAAQPMPPPPAAAWKPAIVAGGLWVGTVAVHGGPAARALAVVLPDPDGSVQIGFLIAFQHPGGVAGRLSVTSDGHAIGILYPSTPGPMRMSGRVVGLRPRQRFTCNFTTETGAPVAFAFTRPKGPDAFARPAVLPATPLVYQRAAAYHTANMPTALTVQPDGSFQAPQGEHGIAGQLAIPAPSKAGIQATFAASGGTVALGSGLGIMTHDPATRQGLLFLVGSQGPVGYGGMFRLAGAGPSRPDEPLEQPTERSRPAP